MYSFSSLCWSISASASRSEIASCLSIHRAPDSQYSPLEDLVGGSITAVGETFLPRIEYSVRPGSATRGRPAVVLDLIEEWGRADKVACSWNDKALADLESSSAGDCKVADTESRDPRPRAESAPGMGSVLTTGVVETFEGRGRDPTGRAGRLFRRVER